MPRVESSVIVPVTSEVAFAISQFQGESRFRWDSFLKRQTLIGAPKPARGVRALTVSHHGLKMVSEYTAFNPPKQVGMKMVKGPWFFKQFAGGWTFSDLPEGSSKATWRYTFSVRPAFLRPIADRVGVAVLQRDVDKRLAGFQKGCQDPVVVEAATAP